MKQDIMEVGSTKVLKKEFNTIAEFIDHMDTAPLNTYSFPNPLTVSSKSSNKGFTLTSSYDEAKEMLTKGWSEGSERLTTALKVANNKMQSEDVKRAIFDVVGFQASVPRYLQGIPTSMVNKKTIKQKQKIVNIHKGITYNGGVRAEEILRDSVKFLQIIQAIEKQGVRANVFVTFYAIKGNERIFVSVKIKSSSERLNISKMSFPLMHPSMLRRFMFRAVEVESRSNRRDWRNGYGQPGEAYEIRKHLGKDEIYVPILITEDQAIATVNGITGGK